MAPKAYTFRATLIGATKQQDVNFCLQSAGISITGIGQNSSRVIANLAFPYIEKISRSACGKGTSRILDISVQTKAGLQNLKVLVETANTVCILSFLVIACSQCVPADELLAEWRVYSGSLWCLMSRLTNCCLSSTSWHQPTWSRNVQQVSAVLANLPRQRFRGLLPSATHR